MFFSFHKSVIKLFIFIITPKKSKIKRKIKNEIIFEIENKNLVNGRILYKWNITKLIEKCVRCKKKYWEKMKRKQNKP